MLNKICCPMCGGSGKVEMEVTTVAKISRATRIKTAKKLRKKGMTIRAIAKAMGYKHPGSVSDLLNPQIRVNK